MNHKTKNLKETLEEFSGKKKSEFIKIKLIEI